MSNGKKSALSSRQAFKNSARAYWAIAFNTRISPRPIAASVSLPLPFG
jgi:hypothetical protein